MGLDDGMRPGPALLDGLVDQAEAEPNVQHIAMRLAYGVRVRHHQRPLPLHHHRLPIRVHQAPLRIVVTHLARQVTLTGLVGPHARFSPAHPALRRAQDELRAAARLQ